ncbi:MAG: hypothetical protein N2648_02895 [Aquificaceae bacterium]|nr:hypothetical protein [Aquificaceae bacterium]
MRKAFAFLAMLGFSTLSPVSAQGLSVGEHYTLRSYTGQALGRALSGSLKFNNLHVLTNNTTICASLVGAIGSGYVDSEGKRRMSTTVLNNPEELQGFNPASEAVALIFGGQASPEVNYGLTRSALRRLADTKYNGAIFFHLRIWAPRFVERAAQEDPTIAQYLAGKENLYTVTADLQNKVIRLWQVSVKDGKQATVRELGTIPMNPTWEDLLRRSL